jgi:hypothetical protein
MVRLVSPRNTNPANRSSRSYPEQHTFLGRSDSAAMGASLPPALMHPRPLVGDPDHNPCQINQAVPGTSGASPRVGYTGVGKRPPSRRAVKPGSQRLQTQGRERNGTFYIKPRP